MTERVEEDTVRADDDAVGFQHAAPQLPILPLVWFVRARNESNGDGEVGRDDCPLLLRERDCRGEEPGDLCWVMMSNLAMHGKLATQASEEYCDEVGHSEEVLTLGDSRSISCFILRIAM